MYLLVFITLVVGLIGIYAETLSIQTARLYSNQTTVSNTLLAWHSTDCGTGSVRRDNCQRRIPWRCWMQFNDNRTGGCCDLFKWRQRRNRRWGTSPAGLLNGRTNKLLDEPATGVQHEYLYLLFHLLSARWTKLHRHFCTAAHDIGFQPAARLYYAAGSRRRSRSG